MDMKERRQPAVLVFAANDPTGGAGLGADILTLASMDCLPLPIVTGITVQNTSGVEGLLAIDSDWVADQARAILEDIPIGAFKIGVLASSDNVEAIAEIVSDYPEIPLILDPVYGSGRGDELAGSDTWSSIRELLVPQSTVITPNVPELLRLTEDDDRETELGEEVLAMQLVGSGAEFVLVTGTHAPTPDVANTLYGERGKIRTDRWARLPGSYHGSGCTLASALAACVARGMDIEEAVREAQEFTWQALHAGFRPGMGQFIPDRLFWAREGATDEAEDEPESQNP